MESKDLRALDAAELSTKLAEFRKELFNLRFQHATAQLENTQRIPAVKKVIARILTIQRQRELGA
ncbi:MAG: 50S ribosomal protein L29 [Desulfovibrionaceae bacterium CG1_02_65_16]|nr:MAG: 50S ribosomal protein L29 [Desulfovibrionaceae bacterium CG1_02_65_16]